jgi:hypothetical protein
VIARRTQSLVDLASHKAANFLKHLIAQPKVKLAPADEVEELIGRSCVTENGPASHSQARNHESKLRGLALPYLFRQLRARVALRTSQQLAVIVHPDSMPPAQERFSHCILRRAIVSS